MEKIDGFQQGFGVGSCLLGEGPDHPGVAALFLGVVERGPRPPDDGQPPVKGGDAQLEEPQQMIAPLQVRQLVHQEHRLLVLIKVLPEFRGDD